MREKLIELLKEDTCPGLSYEDCAYCKYDGEQDCFYKSQADHLIANGVTIQKQDGCKYCEDYEDLPEHFVGGNPVGRVFDTTIQTDKDGLWHLEVPYNAGVGIRFCPMCGRKLPQPPKGE